MKKVLVFLLVGILTLLVSVDVMGAVYPGEENMLTDTWYALNPPPSPHYRVYSFVPYSNYISTNSEYFINDHSFLLMNVINDRVDVETNISNIRASVLLSVGIFIGLEVNYGGATNGMNSGSLGYRWNLNDRGYLAIGLDSANAQKINESGIVLDGDYLSDSSKITGKVVFYNDKITADLQGRIKVNEDVITGLDVNSSKEEYYIGLTWNSSSSMIFDGKVGIHSNNLKYAMSETFILGKHRIGLEYEKLESEAAHQFTLKEKYLISDTSELVIKAGFGGPNFEESPYEPLVLVAYQMNF